MGSCCIPFFMDQNVPDPVGKMLIAAGHDVVLLRECMPTDTKDPIIAMACARHARVLVSHDRDFRAISKRLAITQRHYRQLHRIGLHCLEPNSEKRMQGALALIEMEWLRIQEDGSQLVIELSDAAIRVCR